MKSANAMKTQNHGKEDRKAGSAMIDSITIASVATYAEYTGYTVRAVSVQLSVRFKRHRQDHGQPDHRCRNELPYMQRDSEGRNETAADGLQP